MKRTELSGVHHVRLEWRENITQRNPAPAWKKAWRARVLFFDGVTLVLRNLDDGVSTYHMWQASKESRASGDAVSYCMRWLRRMWVARGKYDQWGRSWTPTHLRIAPGDLRRLITTLGSQRLDSKRKSLAPRQ